MNLEEIQLNSLGFDNTALLVIDVQRDFFSKKDPEDPIDDLENLNSILKPLNTFINECRDLKIPIIFTKYIEEKGKIPSNILEKYLDGFCDTKNGYEFYGVDVHQSDLIVEKNTWDAFTNPRLESYLSDNNIKNLIIVGVTTEMCVFSTVSSAFAKGYTVFVPMELVATQKQKGYLHECVLKLIDLYYGFVVKSEDIIKKLAKL